MHHKSKSATPPFDTKLFHHGNILILNCLVVETERKWGLKNFESIHFADLHTDRHSIY